jgi:hypothetical protein
MSWRLVYENKKIYGLFESSGTTYTGKNLFISDSLDECFDEIDANELNFEYITGDTHISKGVTYQTVIVFSEGTRTIKGIEIEDDIP